eukprot:7387813-Prymnesium_polylepis.3
MYVSNEFVTEAEGREGFEISLLKCARRRVRMHGGVCTARHAPKLHRRTAGGCSAGAALLCGIFSNFHGVA